MGAPPPLVPQAQWQRMHPLSPLVRLGRRIVSLMVAVVVLAVDTQSGSAHNHDFDLTAVLAAIAAAVLGTCYGVVYWLVSRWRVCDGVLQFETGLIRRQSLRVPLPRIQAVDVVAPALARFFGLAEVRVVSAGRGADQARLAYLSLKRATEVRTQLLALAHGLAEDTPEPAAYRLLTVPNERLAAASLLRILPEWFGALVLGIIAIVASGSVAPLAGLVPILVILVLAPAQRAGADFGFTVNEGPDGFRLERGLLSLRKETIPVGRIQAVRWVEPLLWRPFGWCALEVDVARQRIARHDERGDQSVARTLISVATRQEAMWLLSRVMPGASPIPPPGTRPPRRALLRSPLQWHYLALWYDGVYLLARTGRVRPATVIVPLDKVQSVRSVSGPWLRLLGLSDLRIDSAGRRWAAEGLERDSAQADMMLWSIAELACHARRRVTAMTSSATPSA